MLWLTKSKFLSLYPGSVMTQFSSDSRRCVFLVVISEIQDTPVFRKIKACRYFHFNGFHGRSTGQKIKLGKTAVSAVCGYSSVSPNK